MKRSGGPHTHTDHKSARSRDGLPANVNLYDGNFPLFRKPVEIGSFSHDSERKFIHDRSQLKYYAPPEDKHRVHFDLTKGFDTFQDKSTILKGSPELLDDLLRWVLQNRHTFSCQPNTPQQQHGQLSEELVKNLATDFICWRGLLTKLLCTPYENREGWQIAVTRFNGTFYLCDFETDQKKEQQARRTQREEEMTYWGHKFEQYVVKSSPEDLPNTDEPVNNIEDFASIVRSRLESHSLVYGGEVDCCFGKDRESEYVELKTSREMSHPKQEQNFKRFKLIKWWAQSFLIGIELIVGGFRDDYGMVHSLKEFPTKDIHRYCRDIQNCWMPNVCFNFLNKFLEYVKNSVTDDNPRQVYLFTWEPRQTVTFKKLELNSEFCFLPSWYTDVLS